MISTSYNPTSFEALAPEDRRVSKVEIVEIITQTGKEAPRITLQGALVFEKDGVKKIQRRFQPDSEGISKEEFLEQIRAKLASEA